MEEVRFRVGWGQCGVKGAGGGKAAASGWIERGRRVEKQYNELKSEPCKQSKNSGNCHN